MGKKRRDKRGQNSHCSSGSSRTNGYKRQRDERLEKDRPTEYSEDRSSRNDISWYSKYPNILVGAGQFPYPNKPGMTVQAGEVTSAVTIPGFDASLGTFTRSIRIPGVLTMNWMPSFGISNEATDPASIMAKEIYARVRSKFSSSLDADAPDFVVYLGALDSIFSYIAWCKRLYRVLTIWTPENYALPDQVLAGMGLSNADVQNLRVNKTQLWQLINELVLQSRKFTCPAVFDIFNRHYWMSDNVYTDAPELNSQFYMFNLRAVYKYAALNMPTGDPAAGLQMVDMPWVVPFGVTNETRITPEVLYTFGTGLVNALVAWDDAYTINGYLQRAYEGVPNFVIDEIPATPDFVPKYEPEVLMQIENSRSVYMGGFITDLSGFNLTQNVLTNAIISNPSYFVDSTATNFPAFESKFGAYAMNFFTPPMLSIRSTSPTVADSVVASRLINTVPTANDFHFTVDCATEINLGWIYVDRPLEQRQAWLNGTINQMPAVVHGATNGTDVSDTALLTDSIITLNRIGQLAQFDWHPQVLVMDVRYLGGSKTFSTPTFIPFYDIHNFMVISNYDLENLHKVCMYSELNAFQQ